MSDNSEGGQGLFGPRFHTDSEAVFDNEFGFNFDLEETFQEIKLRHLALLNQTGEPLLFLQRRREGDRCPHWVEEQQNCSKPNSTPACYGTGWIGGFYAPIQIFVRIVPAGSKVTWYEGGQRKDREQRSWTLWSPILRERDILVRPTTNERFQLQDVAKLGLWRGQHLRQEFNLRDIPERDMLMTFPVVKPVL